MRIEVYVINYENKEKEKKSKRDLPRRELNPGLLGESQVS